MTLWHFTNPVWFKELGGWANRKAPHYFSRYAAKITNELGRDVKYWITINEPMVYASHAYLRGDWPPQKRSLFKYLKVIRHLVSAHNHAANAIKIIDAGAMVGIAKHNIYFDSVGGGINGLLRKVADWWWNHHFLNEIKKHVDFIGLNNYFLSRVRYGFSNNHDHNVSDLGWGLYPESVYQTLKGLKRYKRPIFITENGLADARDTRRTSYIKSVLSGVIRAIDEGVDVSGYLYWSLLDTFEWGKGFWPRFGLIEVDYETQKRTTRESAKEYTKIIKSNSLD